MCEANDNNILGLSVKGSQGYACIGLVPVLAMTESPSEEVLK